MAVPTIISQLINLIYNMADTIYIGMTGDPYKTAAVTLAFTLFYDDRFFFQPVRYRGRQSVRPLDGFGADGGAKEGKCFQFLRLYRNRRTLLPAHRYFLDPILNLLGASASTISFGQYVWLVVILGDIPIILSMTCAHLLRNAGYAKQASIDTNGGGILNIILDPLFMFVLLPEGMEVFGAAFATLLSNIIAAVYLVWMMKIKSGTTSLSINLHDAVTIKRAELKDLFAVRGSLRYPDRAF